jgi:hypothetical protein
MTKRLLAILPILFTVSSVALGQTDSGAIRVLVEDASTSPVPDAVVKLTNTATGVSL